MTTPSNASPPWTAHRRPTIHLRRPLLRPRWHAAVLLAVALIGPLWGLCGWLAERSGPTAQAMLVLGAVVGAAGLLSSQALMRWDELTLLDGFSLMLDANGVCWAGGRAGGIAWTNTATLAIVGPPRRRRLWITRRGRWQPDPCRPHVVSSIMRSLRLEDLELDLPLPYLSVSEADLAEAIRAASGGVFPTAQETSR